MKIFYFGTICDIANYEKILKNCKTKPTVATIVFESALLEGFCQNGTEIEIASYPMIPNYRNSKVLYWGRKTEHLDCGYTCKWLKTINVIFLKQISRRLDGKKRLKTWLENNKGEDCVVLSYGLAPFLAKDIIHLCKKYNVKNCAIVPDLPRDMYLNSKGHPIKSWMREQYLKPTLKIQGEFDNYIYLTEAMAEVVNPEKPYMVMEGILRLSSLEKIKNSEKENPRGIMYAGGLNEKFGIIKLIDAFEKAAIPNTELWLFGDGNAVEEIREREKKNSKIRLFGRLNREEILEYEKKATLLVNPRSTQDDYTKYSFPSKTIEYMYSGTPLLTTKLPGIPAEYYSYVFSVEDNEINLMADELEKIFSLPDEMLKRKGCEAKQYVAEQKNARIQSKRILEFLKNNEKNIHIE